MQTQNVQAAALKAVINGMKENFKKDDVFAKKLTVVLCCGNAEYYEKKFAQLSQMMNFSETLLMSGWCHRAFHYICMAEAVRREIMVQMDEEYGRICKDL